VRGRRAVRAAASRFGKIIGQVVVVVGLQRQLRGHDAREVLRRRRQAADLDARAGRALQGRDDVVADSRICDHDVGGR
jgi:hypothetical protein